MASGLPESSRLSRGNGAQPGLRVCRWVAITTRNAVLPDREKTSPGSRRTRNLIKSTTVAHMTYLDYTSRLSEKAECEASTKRVAMKAGGMNGAADMKSHMRFRAIIPRCRWASFPLAASAADAKALKCRW